MLRRFTVAIACAVALVGCASTTGPEVRVLGVHEAPRREVVFVQVTNPARRPMQLTKLEYRVASAGTTVSIGELPLAREVPAGGAAVVEVPLDVTAEGELTLSGRLVASVDEIVRSFTVSAQIQAH
jgi:hypothetical protein